ncbi:MAG: S49 family peptidase [Gammaproteobacteria bacterium]|nr:S49 family peptidase [Gammaproteobacteria bacterium]
MSDNQQEPSASATPGGEPAKPEDKWTGGASAPTTSAVPSGEQGGEWERGVLKKLAFSAIDEQRRTRRWGIFFKVLTFAYLFTLLYLVLPTDRAIEVGKKHTALVEIRGEISDSSEANADSIITGLRAAFEDKNTKGVIIRINSPGGSPVQAGYVNDEIKRLRTEYPDIPLYVVITDICASGGYYIAAAADKIYADKASLVGSIGVIMDGFGFVDTMKKFGVERRLLTAGEHKGFLDPFSPQKPEEVEHVRTLLGNIHQQFIDTVKKGRGARLKDDPNLFSGYIWTGEQAIGIGLVDALGSSSYVAREVIGAEDIVDYSEKPPYLQQFAQRFGMAMSGAFSSASNAGLKQLGGMSDNIK